MKNNRLLKRITALVCALVLLVSCFAGCGFGDDKVYRTYEEIKEAGKVRIGVYSDNNPFSFANENGDYQGYEINFANQLAKKMGVKAKFVSTEADDRAKYLETGKVDIVIASYAIEKTAKKLVDFAKPYMKTSLAAVASDKEKIASLNDLEKKDRVIVVSGSAAASYMTENYPDVNLVECGSENEAIDALENNKGVLWLGDNIKVAEFAYQNDGFSLVINELGDTVKYAPAVSKGNSTLEKKINKIIKKLTKEDFFTADYNETLKNVYGEDFAQSLIIDSTSK